jgi:hypothetical protein
LGPTPPGRCIHRFISPSPDKSLAVICSIMVGSALSRMGTRICSQISTSTEALGF